MQSVAAAVTMVRDDHFFLKAWLAYYGGLFGRENCTVINHGQCETVMSLAAGCNIIGLPGYPHANFDVKRWRLLNGLVQGLRNYYSHVVVGDVDELVVADPAGGKSLLDILRRAKPRRVLTPIGLEVVHRRELEVAPIAGPILGPRRHVRLAPHYSKPCIVSRGVKISRGGHFTQYNQLHIPDGLYLLHMKFCDFYIYRDAMDRRNAVTDAVGSKIKDTAIGRHWFSEARGNDEEVFQRFETLDQRTGFDMDWVKDRMHASWKPRGETGFWHFERPDYGVQYRLPKRFVGLI